MPSAKRLCLLSFVLFFAHSHLFGQEEANLVADLDPFINLPAAYLVKPADLDTMFEQGTWNRNPYFKWLTKDKSRAIFQRKDSPNLKVDLTLLGGTVPIEEAIIDFKEVSSSGRPSPFSTGAMEERSAPQTSKHESRQWANISASSSRSVRPARPRIRLRVY